MYKNVFGVTGTVAGFAGFGLSLFLFFAGPINQSGASRDGTVIEKLVELKSTIAGKSAAKNAVNLDRVLTYGSIVLAFLAILAGTIAFIKREDKRLVISSITAGSIGLVFHFILIALGVFIIFAVVAIFLAQQ